MPTKFTGRKNSAIFLLLILTITGLILRILSCYWGYPYQLHPDEHTIVDSAIDMIRRHSWTVNVYNRPDHFEVKCCAALFQIISLIRYHVSSEIAFADHQTAFYLIARGYTAIFGTMMIPLCYLILEKCKKGSGLIGAAIVTFLSIFIEHSGYATPDIVLTFLVMLEAWISILYLEKPDRRKVVILAIIAGLGITVKYTCAICCLYLALIVIYNCVKQQEYKKILTLGSLALVVVLLTCFIMAPNLFTNWNETLLTLKKEARPNHLGADGFGFLGNFRFYFTRYFVELCAEAFLFEIFGILYIIRSKKRSHLCFFLGLLFWICTSVISLHWIRWGIPIYIFFVFLTAIGISYLFDLLKNGSQTKLLKAANITASCFLFLFWTTVLLSGIGHTFYNQKTDSRIAALSYCQANGITAGNSVADGYTPYLMNIPQTIPVSLDSNGKLSLPEDQKDIEYLILCSNIYDRYYTEPERYEEQIRIYDAIQKQCKLVKQFPVTKHKGACLMLPIIARGIAFSEDYDSEPLSGFTISIYKLGT